MSPDLGPLFLNTAYVNALVNTRDQWHDAAARWEAKLRSEKRRLVTTEWVLVEVADSLARVRFRLQAARVIAALRSSRWVETVPAATTLLSAALHLYENRADKDWGLTDCTSFIVMSERGLSAALTTDEHFRQAGFRALLLEDASSFA